jgi:superfamily I DNA and RNA helicase
LERILDFDACLFQDDLDSVKSDSGGAQIHRRLRSCLERELPEPLTSRQAAAVKAVLQPDTVIGQGPADHPAQLTIFRAGAEDQNVTRVMDRRQEDLAKTLGEGHRVIRGVAGSGKTLVLIHRARLMARLHPNKRVLVACYTKTLAAELRTLLAEFRNVHVYNLDKLMAEVIRDAGMRHPGYAADSSGEQVAEAALAALPRKPRTYHAVLLDEAQDFGTNTLKFAVALLGNEEGDLLIVADSAQNIFRRKFSWNQANIKAQGRTKILRTNYRNTREILEFADRILRGEPGLEIDDLPGDDNLDAIIPPEASLRTGSRPNIVEVSGNSQAGDEVARLASSLIGSSPKPRSLAVIYSKKDVDLLASIEHSLTKKFLDCFVLNNDNREQIPHAGQPVIVTTVHSAKGLEFPHVIIVGDWTTREANGLDRRLLYVAMTRATDTLSLVIPRGSLLAREVTTTTT